MFMASNVTKVAVISGWNGPYRSMGPGGHIRCLDLVMRALTGAWKDKSDLIQKDGLGIYGDLREKRG